jgi:hypothetical protein
VPLEQPELFDFYGQVYSEGPMVLLRQMEALFGRDAVLEALAMVLGEPRIVGVHDIRLALEATTGASLDKYFNDWIIGAGAPPRPHFDVAVDNLGAGFAHITLTQREPELGVRGCAFALALRGAAGQSTDAWVDLGPDGREVTELDVDVGFPVTSVTFDPHHHCLAAGTIEIAD